MLIPFLFSACTGGTDYFGESSGGVDYFLVSSSESEETVSSGGASYAVSSFGVGLNLSVSPVFTVEFDTDGGSNVESQTIKSGNAATEPIAPTKSGFVFSGWYTDSELTEPFTFATVITANMTLHAKWIPESVQTYTITFDKNHCDASGVMAGITAEAGATVTLPANTFTKDSFVLSEWNTAQDGSGTGYAAGTDVVLSSDMTLYAIWEYCIHEGITVLEAGTDGTAGTGARYVLFGDYPQTLKADCVTVDESKTKVMGEFTYYLGSDLYWYAKCAEKILAGNIPYYKYTAYGNTRSVESAATVTPTTATPSRTMAAESFLHCLCHSRLGTGL